MVISPPFLPVPKADESEAEWMARAMQQQVALAVRVDAREGSFPISGDFMWHTGLHLSAPPVQYRVYEPVRAIADGKVIHVRQPTPHSTDPTHPLNYSSGGKNAMWSDNGCVILEHTTDIGAIDEVATRFTYYTLTMHLCTVEPTVKVGSRIYRKDVIGQPGQSYAAPADIHLEVCCDEAQLIRLVGGKPSWRRPYDERYPNPPTTDGRIDAVFGDLYIYLPAGTETASAPPKNHLRSRNGAAQTLGTAQWVRIRYEKGQGFVTSLDLHGQPVGAVRHEVDFEYQLYDRACELHRWVTGPQMVEGLGSPGSWYSLLRFGRVLGPDPLSVLAAHWREIPTAAGTVWADLNYPGTRKFSDADFPAIADWNFFADDTDHLDQRCQSPHLKQWIGDPLLEPVERYKPENLSRRLGLAHVRKRLKRAICFFPTEWDQATIEARYGWARDPENTESTLTDAHWKEFRAHAMALTMADLPEAYQNAKWRFHPQEFVAMMKKVGWLSERELQQLIPEKVVRGKGAGMRGPFFYERNSSNAGSLIHDHKASLNRTMRKYGITTPARISAFLANSIQETAWWRNLSEGNGAATRYAPWFGRGFLQLTNSDGKFTASSNYAKYFLFNGHVISNLTARQLTDLREALSSNPFDASESAGVYWSWMRANMYADRHTPNMRREIHLDERSENNPDQKIHIYENASFRKVACIINLPASVDNPDPQLIGLVDRYSAYAVAQVILMDTAQFPQANNSLSFNPEKFASRKPK